MVLPANLPQMQHVTERTTKIRKRVVVVMEGKYAGLGLVRGSLSNDYGMHDH